MTGGSGQLPDLLVAALAVAVAIPGAVVAWGTAAARRKAEVAATKAADMEAVTRSVFAQLKPSNGTTVAQTVENIERRLDDHLRYSRRVIRVLDEHGLPVPREGDDDGRAGRGY